MSGFCRPLFGAPNHLKPLVSSGHCPPQLLLNILDQALWPALCFWLCPSSPWVQVKSKTILPFREEMPDQMFPKSWHYTEGPQKWSFITKKWHFHTKMFLIPQNRSFNHIYLTVLLLNMTYALLSKKCRPACQTPCQPPCLICFVIVSHLVGQFVDLHVT